MTNLADLPGRLENRAGELGVALAIWADHRDPEAASMALEAMDRMLVLLQNARAQLLAETRAGDEAAGPRTSALPDGRRRLAAGETTCRCDCRQCHLGYHCSPCAIDHWEAKARRARERRPRGHAEEQADITAATGA